MKIALGCDHGALALKDQVAKHLTQKGFSVKDCGTYTPDSCDYPDFAGPAAQAVVSGECEKGIVLCTTGIGVCITANKAGASCALVYNELSVKAAKADPSVNMIAFGAAVVGEKLALEMTDLWLDPA